VLYKSATAAPRTAGKQTNKSIPHSTRQEQALYVPHTPQTHERHCLPPLISSSRLLLWRWPPSQRDRKQRAERFQTGAGGKNERTDKQHRGVWKSQSGGSVRVGGGLRHTKKGDERESTGEFSKG